MKIITELLFCVALFSFQPTHWVQEPSDLANNDLIAQSFVQVVSDSKVDVQMMQKDSFIECLEENSCISGDMEKRRSHPLPVFSPSKILMKCRTLNFTFLPSLCRKKLYAFCGSFGKTKPANRRFSRKEKDQYLKKYLNDVKIQKLLF